MGDQHAVVPVGDERVWAFGGHERAEQLQVGVEVCLQVVAGQPDDAPSRRAALDPKEVPAELVAPALAVEVGLVEPRVADSAPNPCKVVTEVVDAGKAAAGPAERGLTRRSLALDRGRGRGRGCKPQRRTHRPRRGGRRHRQRGRRALEPARLRPPPLTGRRKRPPAPRARRRSRLRRHPRRVRGGASLPRLLRASRRTRRDREATPWSRRRRFSRSSEAYSRRTRSESSMRAIGAQRSFRRATADRGGLHDELRSHSCSY